MVSTERSGSSRYGAILATLRLFVLPPCGICREFIRQVDEANRETEFVLGRNKTAKLYELLPEHEWPQPL